MSRPLQVYLDDQDMAALEGWSRQRGWSKSQAIRAAVRALTRADATDPLLAAQGILDDLPREMSAQLDHYLEETYVAKSPRARRPARRRSPARVRR
jgi:hypothetical protein